MRSRSRIPSNTSHASHHSLYVSCTFTEGTPAVLRAAEILAALSPLHARTGLHASGCATYEGCFVLPARGNGGCLFTSLRLAVEVESAMQMALRILDGEAPPQPLPEVMLDGFHAAVVAEANYVRQSVVEWYADHKSHREVPHMGAFEQGGRAWTRADILNMELIKRGAAGLPDDEAQRKALRHAYLNHMLAHTTWGSVPEWTAYAMLRKTPTVAYEWDGDTQRLRTVDVAYGPLEHDPAMEPAAWPAPERARLPAPAYNPAGSVPADDLVVYAEAPEAAQESSELAESMEAESEAASEAESEAAGAASEGASEAASEAESMESPPAEMDECASDDESAPAWRPVTRLLFSGQHYDCILTAQEYYSIRAVFGADAVRCAVPLPQYVMGQPMAPASSRPRRF